MELSSNPPTDLFQALFKTESYIKNSSTCDHLTGIQAARKKHNNTGKLGLHFKADESGIVSLDRAESLAEITEEYTVKVPISGGVAKKPELHIDPEMAKKLDPKILELLKNSKTKVADVESLMKDMESKMDDSPLFSAENDTESATEEVGRVPFLS